MATKTRLLVRVDDAGSSWSSNIGCLRACTEGIAKSVEVMMPCGWVSHAADMLAARPDIDVGIHLTLSSEWDAVKWRPLTNAPSLTDENGHFYPLLLPRPGDTRKTLAGLDYDVDEIVGELDQQIALGRKMFPNASHISTHMVRHFKEFDTRIGDAVKKLCSKYGLSDDAFGHGLPRIEGYPPFPRDAERRTDSFVEQIGHLGAGTYIFIDHPAVYTPALDAFGHHGYKDVTSDRTACLETLTSRELKHAIEEFGIELISYKDLSDY